MALALASLLLVAGPLILPLAASALAALRPPSRRRARANVRLLMSFFALSAAGATLLVWLVARPWLVRHTNDFVLWGLSASLLSAVLATATYVESANARRERRSGEPRCDECGYDLTGNLSGRCPECGAPA